MKWFILLTIIGYQGNTVNMETAERFNDLGACLQRATSDDFRQSVIEMYKNKGIKLVLFHCMPDEKDSDKIGA